MAAFSEASLEKATKAYATLLSGGSKPKLPSVYISPDKLEIYFGYGERTWFTYDSETNDYCHWIRVERQPDRAEHLPDEETAVEEFISYASLVSMEISTN